MSDKKGLIPLVDSGVGYALQAEMRQSGDNYVGDILRRLEDDNPTIVEFFRCYLKYMKTPEEEEAALLGGLMVYRLLESQAEADRMEQLF